MDGRLLPCGDRAVLIEVAGLDDALALRAALADSAGRGAFAAVTDVVPAATTVLLILDDAAALPRVRAAVAATLAGLDASSADVRAVDLVEIDVAYDGEDLDEVARLTGLSASEVVAAHTGTDWRVAFGGFAPGFSYLPGGDPRLEVPRRAEPRTTVPAGAVGLAGSFSGIYPRPSPGGWQLIGRTEATLWDAGREPPALLQPGGRVRFRAVDVHDLPRVEAVETALQRPDTLGRPNSDLGDPPRRTGQLPTPPPRVANSPADRTAWRCWPPGRCCWSSTKGVRGTR